MDFDIGTLVYVLLTLIFLIVGALGKKKKENPQTFETYDEEKQGGEKALENFEERFENLFSDEKSSEEPAAQEREEMYRQTEAGSEEKPGYLLDSPYDKIDDIPEDYNKVHREGKKDELYRMEDHIEEISRKTRLKMVSYGKNKPSFVQKALRDFDPRKAYLYSEIFKPKYF